MLIYIFIYYFFGHVFFSFYANKAQLNLPEFKNNNKEKTHLFPYLFANRPGGDVTWMEMTDLTLPASPPWQKHFKQCKSFQVDLQLGQWFPNLFMSMTPQKSTLISHQIPIWKDIALGTPLGEYLSC